MPSKEGQIRGVTKLLLSQYTICISFMFDIDMIHILYVRFTDSIPALIVRQQAAFISTLASCG